jgi:predicted TPR repeat methyltransferase
MPSNAVYSHLKYELSRQDPWLLETNPYEQKRYDAMLALISDRPVFHSALEVGCAAGAFTAHIVDRCEQLRVLDLLPEAVDCCQRRLGHRPNVVYNVGDVARCRGWGELYDLIVVAEVLYYLERKERIAKAVARLSSLLCAQGALVFCSVIDSVAKGWGLFGAETAMAEWSKYLREERRTSCVGSRPDEQSIQVRYIPL